jgi:transglutaminase-like putative cysteine protease
VRYKITHRTTYRYKSAVTVCHYLARLIPRDLPSQECPWHQVLVKPEPIERAVYADYFGNQSLYFEIEGSHLELEVTAHSFVTVTPSKDVEPATTPAWETVRDACLAPAYSQASAATEFCFASPLIVPGAVFSEYALESFPPNRPILAGLIDLNRRIHAEFTFDPKATDITTPVLEVMKRKRGVCQDFAQVMIACLRSIGLPARYVSGYLETQPPPGKPRLVGADASHAWLALFCGDKIGWMDADPTNNVLPGEKHVTVAWGRDFSDVSPLRGVTIGSAEQSLTVAVDVLAVSEY